MRKTAGGRTRRKERASDFLVLGSVGSRSRAGRWMLLCGRPKGLLDESRPGSSRSITDAQVEQVINKTLESMP
jgi:hypothetical protein